MRLRTRPDALPRGRCVLAGVLACCGVSTVGSSGCSRDPRPPVANHDAAPSGQTAALAAGPVDRLALEPGRYLRLEGVYSARQGADSSAAVDLSFEIAFDVFVLVAFRAEDEADLLVVRSVKPRGGGLAVTSGAGVELARLVRPTDERGGARRQLIASPTGLAISPLLARFVTIEDALPLCDRTPAAGSASELVGADLLGRRRDEVRMRVETGRRDGGLDVRRELVVPDGGLVLPGEETTVRSFVETFRLGEAGAPGRSLLGISRTARLDADRQGFRFELVHELELAARGSKTMAPAEVAGLEAARPLIERLLTEFGRPGVDESVWTAVAGLESLLAEPLFATLLATIRARVSDSYRKPAPQIVGPVDAVVAIGSEAPDFVLDGLDGEPASFRDLVRGRVALLTFWGYGCGPCRTEAPHLTKLLEKYGERGFEVVAVNAWNEPAATVRDFVERSALKQRILLMGQNVARTKYSVRAYPTAFWIDHRGVVVEREVGFLPTSVPEMERRIEQLLVARGSRDGR